MKTIVFRANSNQYMHLDKKYRYIAISTNYGDEIRFFPIYGRENSLHVRKLAREYYNSLRNGN